MLTVGSLFTGIGGMDLGLARAGMEIKWMVEIDDYCQRVLEKHWPEVKRYGDVRECGAHNLEPVDLICGGAPCQPHSVAGKRRGKMAQAFIQEDVTKDALHKRARVFIGKTCEACGRTKILGVHHKDGNPANNAPDNRMTLCASCHTKWHWKHGKKPWKRQSVCKVCGELARKLDMCQKHYQRYRKYGDPLLTKKRRGSGYELVRELPGVENGLESQELRQTLLTEFTDLEPSETP